MTQVSWTRPLALAAALAVLGTVAYWLEFSHKPKVEEQTEQSKKPFALKDVPVTVVRVVDGPRRFTFNCLELEAKLCKPGDNSKWEMTEPGKLRADDSNVNALLSALNSLTAAETLDLASETPEKRATMLKEYRLDPEARAYQSAKRVEVTTAKGENLTLYIGDVHPIGENTFAATGAGAGGKPAQLNESRVLLIPNFFKSNFDHDLTYWRDKKLMTVSAHQIAFFELDGTKADIQASRKDGQWVLHGLSKKAGHGAREEVDGDLENIDNLLNAAGYLAAKSFVTEKKDDDTGRAALKGATKVLTLTLQPEKGTEKEPPAPVILTMYERKAAAAKKGGAPVTAGIFATVSNLDPLYELEPASRDRFDKDVKDLRQSRLITSMERYTAKRLEFQGDPVGAKPLLLVQKDSKWLVDSADGKPEAAQEKVTGFLDKLSGNRIKEFIDGNSVPTGEMSGVAVTLGDERSDTKRKILFWKAGDKLYGRDLQSKRHEAFLVDSALRDALPWDGKFFNKAAPGAAPSGKPAAAPPAKK